MRSLGIRAVLLAGWLLLAFHSQAFAQAPGVLAPDDDPESQSFLVWMLVRLGFLGLLALLSGFVILVGACLVVIRARRPAVIAEYLVFLPLPMLFAVTGALKGLVGSFSASAISGADLKQVQIVGALAEVLVLPLSALLATIPSYLIIAFGLMFRTILAGKAATAGIGKSEPVVTGLSGK